MKNNKREDGSPMDDGINNNTYRLLFGDNLDLPKEESGTKENATAFATIDRFTKLQEKKIFTKLLKKIYKKSNIDLNNISFNKELKQFEYRKGNKVITFDRLSDHFKDDEIKKILMSNKRYGECHTQSMKIAPSIENSRVVTGYVTVGNSKVLHSIVEYDGKKGTIVLDWTRNLHITKEQYVELTKFVELASFDGKEVINDMDKIMSNLKIGVKTYVVFRDELMRDIEKNSHIFKATEEEKKRVEGFRSEEKEDEER
ncbi:MAG: hypothetical protein IJE05_06430 [Clostridia bacterium]|nr:hypothetical protein [Clostridia bacterium]